jgi:hypothetical protein
MRTLARKIVTLDVCSTAVRLMAVNGQRVETWASIHLEPGLVHDGLIIDPTTVGARIRRLMKASDTGERKVIASVCGLFSTCRFAQVPQLESDPTQESLTQAASTAMPVPTEELYLAYQHISGNGSGPMTLLIGTPKNHIDTEMKAFRLSGVRPYILNLKVMALMRLVDPRLALIVNMEPDTIDIAIVLHGIPRIMRTVKLRPGVSAAERVESLAQALQQTALFFNAQHPRIAATFATPLYLAGPVADDPDIVDVIKRVIPYPYTPLAIQLECPKDLPVSQYAVNTGLALAERSVHGHPAAHEERRERTETDD